MRETTLPAEALPSATLTVGGALASARARPAAVWSRPFVRLLAAGSAYGFAFSSFHLLPKFLVEDLAASPADIGSSSGAFGVASVLSTVLVGRCIDRVSRRSMFAISAALLAASSVGFLLVDSFGPLLLALRMLQGAAFTMQMASFSTLVAEMAPPSRLAWCMGLAGSAMLATNALAPAVAEPLADAAGWPTVFALAAAAAGVSGALVLGEGSATGPRKVLAEARATGAGGLGELLCEPAMRSLGLAVVLASVAFAAMFTFLPPAALAAGREEVGAFFVAYATAAVAVRLFGGNLADRFGSRRVAGLALIPYAGVVGSVAVVGPGPLELLGVVFGVAHGFFFPALSAMAIAGCEASKRGRTLTLVAGAFNLGAWGGAALLGLAAEARGYPCVFVLGSASALLAFVVLSRAGLAASVSVDPHGQERDGR